MESTLLRIYMTVSAKVKAKQSLWQRIFNSSLAGYLLKEAKSFGIEQVIIQRISAGYLKGKKLAFDIGEVTPQDQPQCVELIDCEDKLKSFVEKYRSEFGECRVVLFKTAQILG